MKNLLKKFETKPPEIVFEWHDEHTEAKGWVVINSLRNGAAGGGTRMRPGLDRHEVESLAKTMEIKFTISGPPIGGAKSGIDFDPSDPRKKEILERWYAAVGPLLKTYYGTGGDLNVDEVHEVIPITEGIGLWHPQEGIVNGHFKGTEREKIHRIGHLRQGVTKILEDPQYAPETGRRFSVADMITGYGVAEAVRHFHMLTNKPLNGQRAIIQGWGNVGAAAGLYLAKFGVKLVGIIDRNGGLIEGEGMDLQKVKQLFHDKKGNTLVAENLIPFDELNEKIWDVPADIFIPAAASRLVTEEQLNRMVVAGIKVISCGANIPFNDPDIFYGPIMEKADQSLTLIPDFIANCGMARVFAYLMGKEVELTDDAIFADVSKTIEKAVRKVLENSSDGELFSYQAFLTALNVLIN